MHKFLKQVLNYVKNGWPDKCPNTQEWHPYLITRHELEIMEECLLWGRGVIVPIQGWKKLAEALRWGHPGIVKRKGSDQKLFLVDKIRPKKRI